MRDYLSEFLGELNLTLSRCVTCSFKSLIFVCGVRERAQSHENSIIGVENGSLAGGVDARGKSRLDRRKRIGGGLRFQIFEAVLLRRRRAVRRCPPRPLESRTRRRHPQPSCPPFRSSTPPWSGTMPRKRPRWRNAWPAAIKSRSAGPSRMTVAPPANAISASPDPRLMVPAGRAEPTRVGIPVFCHSAFTARTSSATVMPSAAVNNESVPRHQRNPMTPRAIARHPARASRVLAAVHFPPRRTGPQAASGEAGRRSGRLTMVPRHETGSPPCRAACRPRCEVEASNERAAADSASRAASSTSP